MWQDLDPEDSGFVATDKLKDLMEGLDLFAEEEYVDIMRHKIDPDNLGTFKGLALLSSSQFASFFARENF